MEQANTDRPKARSTRKGKPPDTSSEDSYNADGANHMVSGRGRAPASVSPHCPAPATGLTVQRGASLLWHTGTAPHTRSR